MTGLLFEKFAKGTPVTSFGLRGRLYVTPGGWLMLSVPNAVVRGLYDALREPGAELWLHDGKLNAHISVMHADEVTEIGAENITERGHEFSYTLGQLKQVNPDMPGYNAVWFVEVKSPELEQLRKSYGLSKRPRNNEYQFHITVARRKTSVLRPNDVSKAAFASPFLQGAPWLNSALST